MNKLDAGDKNNWRAPLPAWVVVTADVLIFAAALCVFALFHHVLPRKASGPILDITKVAGNTSYLNVANASSTGDDVSDTVQGENDVSAATDTSAQDANEPLITGAEPVSDSTVVEGSFAASFPQEDTGNGSSVYSYQTNRVRVSVDKMIYKDSVCYVADIWVSDISCFKTAFANNAYGQGIHSSFTSMQAGRKAVVAITGDYYSARAKGVVIRDGKLYRNSLNEDVCVLYDDGVMETYTPEAFDINMAIERRALHAWSFGPSLLADGMPIEKFRSSVKSENPRSAIGYFEPGHYCFVTVDGRQAGYSVGLSLKDLSALFYNLGCKAAYNLDGGQTAMMMFQGTLVNQPYHGGRESSDILYIAE